MEDNGISVDASDNASSAVFVVITVGEYAASYNRIAGGVIRNRTDNERPCRNAKTVFGSIQIVGPVGTSNAVETNVYVHVWRRYNNNFYRIHPKTRVDTIGVQYIGVKQQPRNAGACSRVRWRQWSVIGRNNTSVERNTVRIVTKVHSIGRNIIQLQRCNWPRNHFYNSPVFVRATVGIGLHVSNEVVTNRTEVGREFSYSRIQTRSQFKTLSHTKRKGRGE